MNDLKDMKIVSDQKKFDKRMSLGFGILGIVCGLFSVWLFITVLFEGI